MRSSCRKSRIKQNKEAQRARKKFLAPASGSESLVERRSREGLPAQQLRESTCAGNKDPGKKA